MLAAGENCYHCKFQFFKYSVVEERLSGEHEKEANLPHLQFCVNPGLEVRAYE